MNMNHDGNPFSSSIQTDIHPPGFPIGNEREFISGEEKLKRKLKYFFMNPCEKYKAKKKVPWKLILQLVKIILVTSQLATFGISRTSHVDFLEKSDIAFKHLFLKDWDASYETLPYPPATGAFAIYTIPDFFKSVNYALMTYNMTEKIAMGTYSFDNENNTKPPMEFCKTNYSVGRIFAFNESYIFDNKQITECFPLLPYEEYNKTTNTTTKVFDTEKYLHHINQSIYFDALIKVELKFTLTSIHLRRLSSISKPDCYKFNITITYHNEEHNGQMPVKLTSEDVPLKCQPSKILYEDNESEAQIGITILDVLVVASSILSLVLCTRSLVRGEQLRRKTVKFFKEEKRIKLDFESQMEFVNLWHVLIVINDVLTVAGSVLKIQIENKVSHDYEICGVLLGTANLLVWFGVLRYLGFFEKYNILILTMKKSAPNILRFLVCAGFFYFGFAVCGWVVLGPYHIKFRSLSSSMECLFSLVNGDDMYVTFATLGNSLGDNRVYIWWFSRVYVYAFVTLFIYVVLNLFLAVILEAYEAIKFRSLGATSECLFSLVNGDDMYVTFAGIGNSHSYVYYYSRIYLYVFISFFIYVVLSVFISVIMDTYETIKKYYEEGFPRTELHDFIAECTEDPADMFNGSSSSHFSSLCLCSWLPECLNWCSDKCKTREAFPETGDPNESSQLIT